MHRVTLEPTTVGMITRVHINSADKKVIVWHKPAGIRGTPNEEGVAVLPVTGATSGEEFGPGYLLKLFMEQKHLTKGPCHFLLGGSHEKWGVRMGCSGGESPMTDHLGEQGKPGDVSKFRMGP